MIDDSGFITTERTIKALNEAEDLTGVSRKALAFTFCAGIRIGLDLAGQSSTDGTLELIKKVTEWENAK